ncbi:MAG TPA: transglycosylase SLT domain-containing protein [Chitinophagales bacterium]|nr:transglycosylase SLT domain-containing protein [Chitinophagales bacterium]
MHYIRITVLCLLLWGVAKAQVSNSTVSTNNGISLNATDESVNVMDSLLEAYFSTNPAWNFDQRDYDMLGYAATDTPRFTPEIYAERISKINSPIPYTYNKSVQGFLDLYCMRRRTQVSNMLGLSQTYFPMFEAELDRKNMPIELKYLAIIESALNTHAVSKAGATGLWQFMNGTGKLMGLRIDSYVDERRDPYMATVAAVAYLEDLYNIYNDWFLAIAAYNCGPGNVNKALRKAGGGDKTFWDIENYLPKETRGYVPAFIAATYVFEYHKEHNIRPAKYDYDFSMMDTLMITHKMTIEQLAPYVGLTAEEIALNNPALKTKTIPGSPYPYPLRLPMNAVATFYANKDSLYASLNKKETQNLATLAKNVEEVNNAKAKTATKTTTDATTAATTTTTKEITDPEAPVTVSYTVKKGDNLGYISDWFDCSVADIKKWNKLSSTKIVPGQKLKLTVPAKHEEQYAMINKMTSAEKQKLTDIQLISAAPAEKEPATKEVIYYTVKPGDTLWGISQKYPDNTVDKIRELNGLEKNETLKTGTKIKLVK